MASKVSRHYVADLRFRLAAFAPSLPSAVLVLFGRFATVRFRFAAAAAFLMLRRAAIRCFDDAMVPHIPSKADHRPVRVIHDVAPYHRIFQLSPRLVIP